MNDERLLARIEALENEVRDLNDKEEIRFLKSTYCRYVDGGWPEHGGSHMGPVADLFVEDGVWDASPGIPAARGTNSIRALFIELRKMPFAIHNAVNPMIKVDGNTATGHWHFVGASQLPEGRAGWYLGTYDEKYIRTPEGWRYKLMKYTSIKEAHRPEGWGEPPGEGPMIR